MLQLGPVLHCVPSFGAGKRTPHCYQWGLQEPGLLLASKEFADLVAAGEGVAYKEGVAYHSFIHVCCCWLCSLSPLLPGSSKEL